MPEHEIMTVEEVAKYLRVSERTVYDWAQKGEIPCGKLGSTWRFERSVVEKWVSRRLAGQTARTAGAGLGVPLAPERVVFIETSRKAECLNTLIDILATAPEVSDRDELAREIFRREELMSTGIGLGVGIPHVRLASVTDLAMAVGVSRAGLDDYESLDGAPVHIVCMLAAGTHQHDKYLRLLASVSAKLKDEEFRASLLEADTPRAVYEILAK